MNVTIGSELVVTFCNSVSAVVNDNKMCGLKGVAI